jgi:hypothetical protein
MDCTCVCVCVCVYVCVCVCVCVCVFLSLCIHIFNPHTNLPPFHFLSPPPTHRIWDVRPKSAFICDSGCYASIPDAGSLPFFPFEIIRLVCVCGMRQVWACLLDLAQALPAGCSGGPGGVACYVYDEAAGHFLYWGPNSVLRLVPT